MRLVIQADRLYGLALLMLERPREALAVLEEVIPLAEAEDDLSNLCFALNNAGLAYMSLGELERSHEHAVRAAQCAERLGSPTTLAFMLCNRGELASLLGNWERARRDYERAAELLQPVGLTWASAHPLLGLGSLALARGEWEPAERCLGECLDIARRVGSTYVLHMAVEALAERDLVQGRPEAARQRLAPDTSSAGDAEADSGSHTVSLAWAELDLGRAETAVALLERAVASVAKTENAHTQLLALRVRARLDGRQGRYDEGLAGLEQALTLARAMPAPCAEAIILYECGLLYLHYGDAELARGSLEAALAIFRRLGERLYAEQVERALAE